MDLVKAVRAYAEAHYESDGWDFLVECWDDSDIQETISGAETAEEAVALCARVVGILDERRAEVRAEIF